jgi:hypothetical protein
VSAEQGVCPLLDTTSIQSIQAEQNAGVGEPGGKGNCAEILGKSHPRGANLRDETNGARKRADPERGVERGGIEWAADTYKDIVYYDLEGS